MKLPTRRSEVERDRRVAQFAADVQYYLMQQPRQLPSRYLYDELGSALFEAICRLPWYPITRAEGRLLIAHGPEVFRRLAPLSTIVELGSGSGEKLQAMLDAAGVHSTLNVHLVDLSSRALELSMRTLAHWDHVHVTTHQATYERGLERAAATFAADERVVVMFLGSNIGNFDPPACHALLHGIRRELRKGDALLLGADLVKPERQMQLAYDDPLGVTAAFNRNLLVRVNRELGGDFAVDQFAHRAVWNNDASRMEMHLVARSHQTIRIRAVGIEFAMTAGEAIWTESSYKYRPGDIGRLLEATGFRITAQWLDEHDPFALTLAEAI
jgi:dimethylhistidine N-methyltransferase